MIRVGDIEDLSFLRQMIYEADFWDSNITRPTFDEWVNDPIIVRLLSDWGRPGDRFVIAVEDESKVGAAWHRLWTDENHFHGYIDEETPDVGIAVAPGYRSRGIGRGLLETLVRKAQNENRKAMSLSVFPSNLALGLYESFGFKKVGESGEQWKMLLKL